MKNKHLDTLITNSKLELNMIFFSLNKFKFFWAENFVHVTLKKFYFTMNPNSNLSSSLDGVFACEFKSKLHFVYNISLLKN